MISRSDPKNSAVYCRRAHLLQSPCQQNKGFLPLRNPSTDECLPVITEFLTGAFLESLQNPRKQNIVLSVQNPKCVPVKTDLCVDLDIPPTLHGYILSYPYKITLIVS